jgi:hypothetical protein
MKIKQIILIFLSALIIGCSGFSSSEDINKSLIKEMLDDIKISFNLIDLGNIMYHYHEDFFHQGDFYEDELIRWESRLINYEEMNITDVEVELNGGFAVVYFTLIFNNEEESNVWSEPSEANGDISYLIFSDDKWQIYGNQLAEDQLPQ